MKRIIFFLFVCFMFSNCKHQVSRIGYNVDTESPEYTECNIPVKKFEIIPDTVATKIGTIKLSDAGFSNSCSEEEAIILLKKEGCALKADFINITKETKPNEESKCYRCRADFYKFRI